MTEQHRGYLIIADITGYTRFLTGSELGHAQGILEDLFQVLTAGLTSPLQLSNIQGDAIFAYAPIDRVPDGYLMIDSVEELYFGFRERLAHMERNSTCPCAACANMLELDLKLLVHVGEYVEHELGGHRELSGSDVIAVHRLLKNRVAQETGITAYALFTEDSIAEIGDISHFADAQRYRFEDADLGSISARVLDMAPIWQRRQEQASFMLGPNTKLFIPEITRTIEATPDVVWYFLLDPEQRPRWFVDAIKLDRRGMGDGRLTSGTVDHCAHGNGQISKNIFVDVRPYRYVTYDVVLPMNCRARISMILEQQEAATALVIRVAQATGPGLIRTGLLRLTGRLFVANKLAKTWHLSLENLAELVAREALPETGPRANRLK